MKFIITRTSVGSYNDPKVDGARQEEIIEKSFNTCQHIVENSNHWLTGSNLTKTDANEWSVEHKRSVWVIYMDCLESLMYFIKQWDSEVVITAPSREIPFPIIEIYDDYRI